MKKLSFLLIALLALAGCASSGIEPVSNELLFTINGKEIKEADIFDAMKLSSGSVGIVQDKAQKMLLKEIVEEDEAFDKKVQEVLQEAKDLMGDNFELTLKQNGFENEDEYVEKIIKDIVRQSFALTKVMSDDYEALKSKRARKVRVLEVKATDGKKVLELLKAGESFETLDKEYGQDTSYYHGDEILVSEISDMDTSILNALLGKEETGIVESVQASSKGETAYVGEVTNIDADALKDEAIESFINNSKLTKEYMGRLFVEHNFKLYDQDLYDAYLQNYPEFIK